jgi:hypothetical protein
MNNMKYHEGNVQFLVITKAPQTLVEVHFGMCQNEKELVFTKQDAINELSKTQSEQIQGPNNGYLVRAQVNLNDYEPS